MAEITSLSINSNSYGFSPTIGGKTFSNCVTGQTNIDWSDATYDDYLATAQAIQYNINMHLYPCVSQDTLITMADGSKKEIQYVRRGDAILSYNPTTKEKCTAYVIAAYRTGETFHFNNQIFSDGKHLCTYGHHSYYDDEAGYSKNIEIVKPYATGAARSWFLNEDLQRVLVTTRIPSSRYCASTGRYNLISSNNLYFANGILLAHSPVNKLIFFANRKKIGVLPQDILQILSADCDTYNAFNAIFENPEYLTETAEARNAYHLANRTIIRDRKLLAFLDYKVMKHTEGHLSEEEYQEVITRKEQIRARINEYRPIYHENLALIKAANDKYRNGATARSIFEECCDRDNAAIESFHTWLSAVNKQTNEGK